MKSFISWTLFLCIVFIVFNFVSKSISNHLSKIEKYNSYIDELNQLPIKIIDVEFLTPYNALFNGYNGETRVLLTLEYNNEIGVINVRMIDLIFNDTINGKVNFHFRKMRWYDFIAGAPSLSSNFYYNNGEININDIVYYLSDTYITYDIPKKFLKNIKYPIKEEGMIK